jgi:hypothetical protein
MRFDRLSPASRAAFSCSIPSSRFAIIKTRWQTRPLSRRAKRRSSTAPGSLRKKYAGMVQAARRKRGRHRHTKRRQNSTAG